MSSAAQSIAGAIDAYMTAQEVAARNLANVTTPGFKRNIALLEAVVPEGQDPQTPVPTLTGVRIAFGQGDLAPTYGDLDLAIQGEGFFTVDTPDGLRYTRNGRFRLDENRVLVTQDGFPVLGQDGQIQVPQTAGALVVSRSGEVRADGVPLARLRITAFENPEQLQQAGRSLFADPGAAGPVEAASYEVHQGFVERSNVQPIEELVRMIALFRDYEACVRSLSSIEDSAGKLYAWART